jgi:hypothetical protein
LADQHLADPGNPTKNFDLFFNTAGIGAGDAGLGDHCRLVLASCEADFDRLAGLFGTGDRFGRGNRIRVVLDAGLGIAGGKMGENDGFHSDGTTTIRIAASANVYPARLSSEQLAEALRAIFVAELTEIFLSLRSESKETVSAAASDGEALSRVFAAWLHPVGYYEVTGRWIYFGSPALLPASHWLSSPTRDDSVTQPYPSWQNAPSIGCGILFFYYLHTQLSRKWSEIVDGLGRNLADTYANLGLSGNAFQSFQALVDGVFPTGAAYDLAVEDIFPLLDPKRRHIYLEDRAATDVTPESRAHPLAGAWVDVRPFHLCPVGHYHYDLLELPGITHVTATVTGFGRPVFRWAVEGQRVTGDQYTPTWVTLTAAGWNDDPQNPGRLVRATAQVKARASVSIVPGDSMTITVQREASTPAHFSVPVRVEVVEATNVGGTLVQETWAQVETALLDWDEEFKKAREGCRRRLLDLMRRYTRLREIVLLRTLPDPPPDWMTHGVQVAARLQYELRVLAEHDRELAEALREQLGMGGDVSENR